MFFRSVVIIEMKFLFFVSILFYQTLKVVFCLFNVKQEHTYTDSMLANRVCGVVSPLAPLSFHRSGVTG